MHEYGSTFILLNLIVLIVTCRIKRENYPILACLHEYFKQCRIILMMLMKGDYNYQGECMPDKFGVVSSN